MALPDIRHGLRGIWSPLRDLSLMQRQFERMFDDAGSIPACDVEETDNQYIVGFDLPGVKKSDVKVEVRDHQLTISGERKNERKGRTTSERYYGSFTRSFTLPSNIEADQVEAQFENGVLQITIPKLATSTSKQIPIKEGKQIEVKSEKAA